MTGYDPHDAEHTTRREKTVGIGIVIFALLGLAFVAWWVVGK